MEETPFFTPELESPEEAITTPEKPAQIGDLLLKRYELPESDPGGGHKLAAQKDPNLLLNREKLRSKLKRYRQAQPAEVTQETNAENTGTKDEAELVEAYFERRHEAIDQSNYHTPDTQESDPGAPLRTEKITGTASAAPMAAPASPPPIMPNPLTSQPLAHRTKSTMYKKPLMVGLVAGLATALTLITIYFIR